MSNLTAGWWNKRELPKCGATTGAGRYHCTLDGGHSGRHRHYPHLSWDDDNLPDRIAQALKQATAAIDRYYALSDSPFTERPALPDGLFAMWGEHHERLFKLNEHLSSDKMWPDPWAFDEVDARLALADHVVWFLPSLHHLNHGGTQ